MRIPRIYTSQTLTVGEELLLESGAAHHLFQVLRCRPGMSINLFNGEGGDYAAEICQTSRKQVSARISKLISTQPRGGFSLHLGIGISKGERMDFALQKAVELGISQITPLVTRRCQVKLNPERWQRRLDHWQKVIIGACEQSGRQYLAQLNPQTDLTTWLGTDTRLPGLLLGHRSKRRLGDLKKPENGIRLLVGPEGGLCDEEQQLALNQSFQDVRLGPRVLRTETAPLAALAAIQTLWGDF
ncbi:MAG: 16S rRNA (uracil(1498)-N(3))-methyltransferase [Gammaproteobacteria bacterium]|nr:16S rRNA (uracil(1498)-N(3))-methyltransferase [Gammaproteobacteria bacterium]